MRDFPALLGLPKTEPHYQSLMLSWTGLLRRRNILYGILSAYSKLHREEKQRLINRKRHRHTANEGMDSYR